MVKYKNSKKPRWLLSMTDLINLKAFLATSINNKAYNIYSSVNDSKSIEANKYIQELEDIHKLLAKVKRIVAVVNIITFNNRLIHRRERLKKLRDTLRKILTPNKGISELNSLRGKKGQDKIETVISDLKKEIDILSKKMNRKNSIILIPIFTKNQTLTDFLNR